MGNVDYLNELIMLEQNTMNMGELIEEFWSSPIEYEKTTFSPETIKKLKLCALIMGVVVVLIVIIVNVISFVTFKIEETKFNHAVRSFEAGNYNQAIQEFLGFDEGSDFYLKADAYIRKYKTAENLFNAAFDFYTNKKYDEALDTLSTIKIVVHTYPRADRLEQEIDNIKVEQEYMSEQLSDEGIMLLERDDFIGAYDKYEKAVSYAETEGKSLKQLRRKIAEYAANKLNEAQVLFDDGKVTEAAEISAKIAEKFPDFSRVRMIDKNISLYYSAVEKVTEAEKLFGESKFSEANELFEMAAMECPVILKTHVELLQKIKGSTISREFMTDEQKAFLDKLEITNVLYTENVDETGMILMFDMKNITEESFEFSSYWCQAEIGEDIFYPEPATQERYASAIKIENGQVNTEYAEDDLVIKPGETYRIMYSFSGERELYTGAILYYVDRTHEMLVEEGTDGEVENALKIPLLQIE